MISQNTSTDSQIIKQVLAGQQEAFGILVERYMPVVHAMAFAHTHNHADAQDVAQESFIKAYKALDSVRDRGKFGAWLASIVRNTSRNLTAARRPQADLESQAEELSMAPPDFERREIHELLRRQVALMPPQAGEILLLHYFAGKSTQEMAQILDISRHAAKKRLERARESLSKQLLAEIKPAIEPESPQEDRTKGIMGVIAATIPSWKGLGVAQTTATAAAASKASITMGGAMALKKLSIIIGIVLVIALAWRGIKAKDVVEPSFDKETTSFEPTTPQEQTRSKTATPAVAPAADLIESARPASNVEPSQEPDMLPQGAVVSGRVIDAVTGNGIPNVKVVGVLVKAKPATKNNDGIWELGVKMSSNMGELFNRSVAIESGQRYYWESRSAHPFVPVAKSGNWQMPKFPFAVTDQDGAFSIKGLSPGHCVVAIAVVPGYRPPSFEELKNLELKEHESLKDVVFTLSAQDRPIVSGHVVDETGHPVAGAIIGACAQGKKSPVIASAISDDDGSFKVYGLPSTGAMCIVAQKYPMSSGLQEPILLPTNGLDDLTLTLYSPGTISGQVVNTQSEPVPGYKLFASRDDEPSSSFYLEELLGKSERVTSDENGGFQLTALCPGMYSIYVREPGKKKSFSSTSVRNIEVLGGHETQGLQVVVDTGEKLSIAGYITDAAGNPLQGASISDGHSSSIRSDENGYYEITELNEGVYDLYVRASKYSTQRAREIEAGRMDVDFALELAGAIKGKVVHAGTGAPILDATVDMWVGVWRHSTKLPERNPKSVERDTGEFRFDYVDVGPITVSAKAPGFVSASLIVTVEPGDKTEALVSLQPGMNIKGIMRDLAGNTISDALVFLNYLPWKDAREQSAIARSDTDGNFVVSDLPSGQTRLVAFHPGYAPHVVMVTPSEQSNIEVTLSIGGTVEGTLLYDGMPLANQGIYIHLGENRDTDPLLSTSARTDEAGFFRIEHAPPGVVFVRAYLRISDAPYCQRWETREAVVQNDQITQVDFELLSGSATVEGRVSVAEEMPPIQNYISIQMEVDGSEGPGIFRMSARPDGTFSATGVPAGTATLDIRFTTEHDGIEQHRYMTADIPQGESVWLDIELTE